jgi:hypothetical protein
VGHDDGDDDGGGDGGDGGDAGDRSADDAVIKAREVWTKKRESSVR